MRSISTTACIYQRWLIYLVDIGCLFNTMMPNLPAWRSDEDVGQTPVFWLCHRRHHVLCVPWTCGMFLVLAAYVVYWYSCDIIAWPTSGGGWSHDELLKDGLAMLRSSRHGPSSISSTSLRWSYRCNHRIFHVTCRFLLQSYSMDNSFSFFLSQYQVGTLYSGNELHCSILPLSFILFLWCCLLLLPSPQHHVSCATIEWKSTP